MDLEREQVLLVFYDGMLDGRATLEDLEDYLRMHTKRPNLSSLVRQLHESGASAKERDEAIAAWHAQGVTKEDLAFLRSLQLGLENKLEEWTRTPVRLRGVALEYMVGALDHGGTTLVGFREEGGGPVFIHGKSTLRSFVRQSYIRLYDAIFHYDPSVNDQWISLEISLHGDRLKKSNRRKITWSDFMQMVRDTVGQRETSVDLTPYYQTCIDVSTND